MRLCHLIPFCRLTVETSLSPEACASLLKKHIASRTWTGRLHTSDEAVPPFRGSVSPKKFKILRNLGRHDGWQPVVVGKIKATPTGSRIRIRMRLMIPGYLAAIVLHLFTTALALAVMVTLLEDGSPFGLAVLAVYVFGISLVLRSFWGEAMVTQRFLLSLFSPTSSSTQAGLSPTLPAGRDDAIARS